MQTKILENCKHTHTHTNTHTHWTHAGHTHRNIHIIVQRFAVYCLYHVLPKNHNEENETKKWIMMELFQPDWQEGHHTLSVSQLIDEGFSLNGPGTFSQKLPNANTLMLC